MRDPTQGEIPRYRFAGFVVSPSRRSLFRNGSEVPLIPRYFDFLLLLLERRNQAVSRREILDTVWSDVVVSDGALNQAVRILRRALGDDSRDPVFIKTVPRHGYRFVFADVVEEPDEEPLPGEGPSTLPEPEQGDALESALAVLVASRVEGAENEETQRREAAETLHALGTEEALRRLDQREGHAEARALLRDTRWDVQGAGPVPLIGRRGGLRSVRILFGMRMRRALRLAGNRWAAAAGGGALTGLIAGIVGALVLRFGPGSTATHVVLVALPVVGVALGGLGAAAVGAGLAAAEVLVRSSRGFALVILGALGGGAVGGAGHLVGRWTLEGVFGRDLSPIAGTFEGLVIGAAAGFGYALSTPRREGGMAAPQGAARFLAAAATGVTCAAAAATLGWTGSHLGAMSLDFMAQSFPGSEVSLAPLAFLLGESEAGPVTRTVVSGWEGLMFGFGVALGLTRRPG